MHWSYRVVLRVNARDASEEHWDATEDTPTEAGSSHGEESATPRRDDGGDGSSQEFLNGSPTGI